MHDSMDMHAMIADYMEKGFVENIIDMLRQDPVLFDVMPKLIVDERSRVRMGAVILAETFRGEHAERLRASIWGIAEGMKSDNPGIRGDTAYLLSTIGDPAAIEHLEPFCSDPVEPVRQVVAESIAELRGL